VVGQIPRPLQQPQRRALGLDDLAVRDDLVLHVGDVAHDVLGAPLGEDRLAHAVELEPDLVEDREAVVEELREDLVEHVARALREVLLAPLLVVLELREEAPDRLQRHVRQRDDVVAPDEDVQLGRVEAGPLLVVVRDVEHDEHVLVVLVDLGSLPGGEDVLEIELVELEVLREPSRLDGRRLFQLNPAQAGALDLSDAGLGALFRPLRRAMAPSYCPRDPGQVRHRGSPSRSGRPCLPFYRPKRPSAPLSGVVAGEPCGTVRAPCWMTSRPATDPPRTSGCSAARMRASSTPTRGGSTGSLPISWRASTRSRRWGWPSRCSARPAPSPATPSTRRPRRRRPPSRGRATRSSPAAGPGSWRPATRAP